MLWASCAAERHPANCQTRRKIAFRIARVEVAEIEYGVLVLTTDLEGHGNQRFARLNGSLVSELARRTALSKKRSSD
jgi:hypothetical protein